MGWESGYYINLYKNDGWGKDDRVLRVGGNSKSDALGRVMPGLLAAAEMATGQDLSALRWIGNQRCDTQSDQGQFLEKQSYIRGHEINTLVDDNPGKSGIREETTTTIRYAQFSAVRALLEIFYTWCIANPQEVTHRANLDTASFCKSLGYHEQAQWASYYPHTIAAIAYAEQFDIFSNGDLLRANDGNTEKEYLCLIKGLLDCFKYAETQPELTFEYLYEVE